MIWKRNCVLCWINNLKRGRRVHLLNGILFITALPHLGLESHLGLNLSPTLGSSWSLFSSFEELPFLPPSLWSSFLPIMPQIKKGIWTMPEGYSKSSLPKREVPAKTFPFRKVPLGQEGAGFVNIHPLYQVRSPKFKRGTEASGRRSIWGGWAVGSIPWVPTLFLSQADTYIGYALLWWRGEDSERHHGCLGKKKIKLDQV